jgi:hypothetical protein
VEIAEGIAFIVLLLEPNEAPILAPKRKMPLRWV